MLPPALAISRSRTQNVPKQNRARFHFGTFCFAAVCRAADQPITVQRVSVSSASTKPSSSTVTKPRSGAVTP